MTIKVFDFFSGCGGTSKGFELAGLEPIFSLDFDIDAHETFKLNFPGVHSVRKDITKYKTKEIESLVLDVKGSPTLFCGCAPCQPFTKQKTNKKEGDSRISLLTSFQRFVKHYEPDYVFVENVPGIQKVQKGGAFNQFCNTLDRLGYFYAYGVIASQDYGVPQQRRRLVLLASKYGEINLPEPTHGPGRKYSYSVVKEWIGDLPRIDAGGEDESIPNHRAAKLSELNLQRIKMTPPGGDRRDWPKHLWLKCHTKDDYSGHSDVYGRMKWEFPATGLTTRCISLSNGRYGHPEQDRAISVREAACLQTFPRDFVFWGAMNSQARQVGNAVPVLLAKVFGDHILSHFKNYNKQRMDG